MLAGAPMLCCSRANIFSACVCVCARRDRNGDDYQRTQTRQSASFLFLKRLCLLLLLALGWPDFQRPTWMVWRLLSFTALACIALRTLWRFLVSHHTVSFLPSDVTTNRRQPPDVFFFHRPSSLLLRPHAVTDCPPLFSSTAPFSPSPPIILFLLSIPYCQAAKVESVIAEGGASRFR